jgi:hypothetical protein
MGQAKTTRNTGSTNSNTSGMGGGTAVATRPASRKATSSAKAPMITHDQIARRAHEIWVQRGCKPGTDRQNWLEAEAQLKAELKRK